MVLVLYIGWNMGINKGLRLIKCLMEWFEVSGNEVGELGVNGIYMIGRRSRKGVLWWKCIYIW